MGCSIREATEADFGALCRVLAEVDALHREALPQVFREADGPVRSPEFLSGIVADENATLLVAEQGGQVVGVAHAYVREARDVPILVPRRYAVIDSLAVAEPYRRLAIGRGLVERIHRWAMANGARQVELNVWEFNQGAIAFYEALGYRTASRRMWLTLEGKEGRHDGGVV